MIRSILNSCVTQLKTVVSGSAKRRRKHNAQYAESIEVRVLPAAVNVLLENAPGGTSYLTITGSAQADSVQFSGGNEPGTVLVSSTAGTTFRLNGAAAPVASFQFIPAKAITLKMGAGNDRVDFLTSLPNISIEDGVNAAEDNTYTVQPQSEDARINKLIASVDRGSCQFIIIPGRSLEIASLDFTFTRTTRSTVFLEAGSEGAINVMGDVKVNSLSPTSADTISIRGTPNVKFDQQLEANLKLLGAFSAHLGGGADYVEFRGTVAVSGTTFIETGDGNDVIELMARVPGDGAPSVIGVVSPTFRNDVTILTGAGDDTVRIRSVDNQLRIRFYRDIKVYTENGVDSVGVTLAEVRGKSDFDLGNGGAGSNPASESVVLEQTEFFGTNRVSIHGPGQLQVTGKGFFPARFRDAATFVIGANNLARNASNFVAIGSADPTSRVVFHKSLWIFGIYAAHPVNAAFRGFVRLDPALKYLTNTIEI